MAEDDVAASQTDEETETEAGEGTEDPKEILKKVVQVQVADAGVLRKTVTVTVPRESLDSELDKDYKELISDAIVPGFRRGRAPRRLVEKRFGSEVGEQVQTRIIPNAYMAAIEKEDLKVLGDPMVWVKMKHKKAKGEEAHEEKEQLLDMPTALQHMKLPEQGDLTFKCEIEMKPQFELPSLEDVPVEKPAMKVSDEDVDARIDRIRAMRGNWVPVADGAVEEDDLVICNTKMTVGGKVVKTEENVRLAARPQRLEGAVLENLGEVLEGAKIGDVRRIEGELPDDHEMADLRGKQATFELAVNEIKRLELPPLEEQYFKSQGFDTLGEYRAWLKDMMQGELDSEIKRSMREQVRQYLLDKTQLDLPEGVSARQTERVVLKRMIELQRRGVPQAEIEKYADKLRTGAQEQAVAELKLYFILEEIAEKLEIEVTEEEINGQIAAMARAYNRRFDRVRDDLAKNNGIESLYLEIRDEKCIDKILEKAKLTEAKVEKKPAKKKSAKPAKAEKAEQAEKPAAAEKAVGEEKKTKPRRTPPPK
jgi:trigger factor